MDGYADIEIRIGPWDEELGAHPVEAALGDGGVFSGGRLVLDQAALRAAWLDANEYGRLLTEALIAGPIRQAYDLAAAQAEATAAGRLRVRLRIDTAAAELHALLWERLRHRHRGRDVPLSSSALTPFSRYVSLQAAEVAPLSERPVRLLIAIANPADLPPSLAAVEVEQEIEGLAGALGDLREHHQLAVTILPGRSGLPPALCERLVGEGFRVADGPSSLDNIRRLLLQHHALHLVSHGSFQRGGAHGPGSAALHLESDDGSWQAVRDDRLVPALAAAGVLPHLIVLVACESARRDDDTAHPFVGLGPKLVEAGVPAVVAMQDRVTVRAARQLAGDFWCDLLTHGEVDRALNAARLLLVDDEGSDWSTPVLFMRLADGRLFIPQPAPADTAVSVSLPLSVQREAGRQDEEPAASDGDRTLGSQSAASHVAIAHVAERSSGSGLRSVWERMPDLAKMITGLTGLVTAIAGLLTALAAIGVIGGTDPTPSPDPPPSMQQVTFDGQLLDAQIEDGVTLGEGCLERNWPCQKYTEAQYPAEGKLINFEARLQGYTNRECEVKWTLYDARTRQPVPNFQDQPGWPKAVFTPEGPEDSARGEVWVPLPMREGEFFVRLMLFNDIEAELDRLDTASFSGLPADTGV